MIEIHPNLGNQYSCPVCDGPVELKDFIINGMRDLAYAHPHHTTFSLARFTKTATGSDAMLGTPTIVFSSHGHDTTIRSTS